MTATLGTRYRTCFPVLYDQTYTQLKDAATMCVLFILIIRGSMLMYFESTAVPIALQSINTYLGTVPKCQYHKGMFKTKWYFLNAIQDLIPSALVVNIRAVSMQKRLNNRTQE